MKFAVFDLDHTLLPVDSGENWSRWLVRAAGMDVALMDARIEAYAEAYRKGAFSADEFMGFQAGLLAACRRQDLEKWCTARQAAPPPRSARSGRIPQEGGV